MCGSNGCGGSCGSCEEGDTCIGNGTCISAGSCTCESFGYECGNHNICGVITHCGNCGIGEDCDDDWACLNPEECGASWKCVERTCDDHSLKLNYRCGYQYICGLNITSGVCSYGLDCVNNWCYSKESCTDTCSSLEYGCGIHTICGQSVNCGGCGNGEICNEDNLCIYATCTNGVRDGTETGVDCGGICLDCVLEPIPGVRDIFYVAPWGDDSNPGTFEQPWETWQKVFSSNGPQHSSISPGDVVYFRGGVYYRNTSGYNYLWYSGTPNAPISFLAYPGERPILDGEYINTINNSFPYFVLLLIQKYPGEAATTGNFYFKGLEIRNFHDIKGGFSDGIHANGQNITFENIIVHSSSNDGISVGATNITLINCDFYNNFNIYNSPYTPLFLFGDNGNGVVGHVYSGGSSRGFTSGSRNNFEPYYSVDGVRTWNNSDGGFGIAGEESATINNTWVFLNGYALGDGDGWKGSYIAYNDNQSTAYIKDIRKNFTNIISAGNKVGFKDDAELARWRVNNLFVYHNGYQWPRFYRTGGIYFCGSTKAPGDLLYNNIEYDNALMNIEGSVGANCFSSDLIHSHNTWDSSVTVSASDFLGLDILELTRPRKANGSLPDVNFGHLASGSDLIDAGVVVEGYHCATAGAHPGEDCREWYGAAPDLGPFESNY